MHMWQMHLLANELAILYPRMGQIYHSVHQAEVEK